MQAILENIEFEAWKLQQHRAKPGKVIRRAFPELTDKACEDLQAALAPNVTVEISSCKKLWQEAYSVIYSCMQGKGLLCHEAYSKVGVQCAVLRVDGNIVARMLVSCVEGVYMACEAYGECHYILKSALQHLGRVEMTCHWLKGLDVHKVKAYQRNQRLASINVPIRQFVPANYSGKYLQAYSEIVGWKPMVIRGTRLFTPWVDGV